MKQAKEFATQVLNSIDGLICDVNAASVEGQLFLVANSGHLLDMEALDELQNNALKTIAIIRNLKGTYDTDEYNRIAAAVNAEFEGLWEAKLRPNQIRTKLIAKKVPVYIYLMLNERTGHYKIGFSKEPVHREKTLQADEPSVTLLAFYSGEKADERHFHTLFADKRGRGEWFTLTDGDIMAFHAYFLSKRTV